MKKKKDPGSWPLNRLAPLVSFAYAIHQGTVAIPPPAEEPEPAKIEGCSFEDYKRGVEDEIERKYTFPSRGFEVLKQKALSGVMGYFTEDDCVEAIRLLNQFLEEGLYIESGMGDSKEALEKFKKEVPGLSTRMYSDYLGMLAWVNR